MKTCLYIVGLILLVQSTMAETEMEVVLIEHIPDEARGWCIDSAGHQINAIMEGGVHGHTCYSYEGQLAVDQKFDAEGVENGYLRLSAF
jgi:hypothetical protein